MSIDIFNIASPAWMEDPRRKCAIPPQYDTPETIGAFADQWHPSPINERQATRLCRGCPKGVKTACLRYALDRPELEGVWGGTTTAARRLMRGESVA